jgi:hypothetical protein
MSMIFNASIEVPDSVEEALPTARKIALKRDIAGTKRKRYLAAKALETKNSVHKSKKFCHVLLNMSSRPPPLLGFSL